MNILVASRNKHKLEEIRTIFNLPDIVFVSANEISGLPEVIEDGTSFQVNAVKKAVTSAMFAHMWTIADDSGLEVDALGGAPGIHSARYAGEPVDYAANNVKLLKEMEGISLRSARFWCVVALSNPSGRAQIVEAKCEGHITCEIRGKEGFGFDPLFVPDGYEHAFAEMHPTLKNKISHRALAFRQAKEKWSFVLAGGGNDWPRIQPAQRSKQRRQVD
jgi:XTP/dITP diphosphohydrolase